MLSRRSLLLTVPWAVTAAALAAPKRPGPGFGPDRLVSLAEDADETVARATAALRGFSADVYRDLASAATRSPNLVCAPYSVAVALAMIRSGARGGTASELDSVLHAPTPAPEALNAGLCRLGQLLTARYPGKTGEGAKTPRLDIANGLWHQLGMAIEPTFTAALDRYYGAAARGADFARAPDPSRREINTWISEHTNGKIPELLKTGTITPSTLLVLANALYLKASWERGFDPKLTRTETFTKSDGSTVAVPMMVTTRRYLGYLAGDGWVAVDLPYAGRKLAMALVIPTKVALGAIEARLDAAALTGLLTGFVDSLVSLRMPKWTVRHPVELGGLLARLGMPTAFTPRADFSGISTPGKLWIDKVVHETYLSVDENGTEAAAATAIVGVGASPAQPIEVVADRPFLYVIHDVETATPLFIGRVEAPS